MDNINIKSTKTKSGFDLSQTQLLNCDQYFTNKKKYSDKISVQNKTLKNFLKKVKTSIKFIKYQIKPRIP